MEACGSWSGIVPYQVPESEKTAWQMVGTCLNSFASHTCRDADFQPDFIPVVMALLPRCTNSDQNNSSGTLLLFEGAGRSDNFHLDDTLF